MSRFAQDDNFRKGSVQRLKPPFKFILRLDRSAEALRHPKANSRFLLCASRIVGMTFMKEGFTRR
jgi:hypothetical protein